MYFNDLIVLEQDIPYHKYAGNLRFNEQFSCSIINALWIMKVMMGLAYDIFHLYQYQECREAVKAYVIAWEYQMKK
jgi:hypothetical protein